MRSMRLSAMLAICAAVAVISGVGLIGSFQGEAHARQQAVLNLDGEGVILKGYDPVSYFDGETGPRPGRSDLSFVHNGATYLFASEANRAAFRAEPNRYAPQYGGHCSFGVRMGQRLDIDPLAYRIIDGRLFLQLDPGTRLIWMMDETENISIADRNWPQLVDEAEASRE